MDSVDYELLHDHAVIRFSGELTWESATELANLIDTLTMRYFYKRIELVIHSPGGLAAALEHLARAIAGWRERGVHLRTRVFASAASAAAVLLSMGDERIAEPEARLLYHLSRVLDPGAVTAHASAQIHDELTRIDARIIRRLVERALREPNAAQPHQPHQGAPSDRRMLRHLIEATPRSHDTRPARSVKHLARALGRAVDDAVRGRDRKALTRVYQALAETDLPISAPLARTLRLIDHVGVPEPHNARPAGTPGLTIPQWRMLYGPSGNVPREVLTRHALVLGETGSGKTASAILPVVAAMARAPREQLGAGLLIDPKRDFAPMLQRLAPHRLHHFASEDIVLDVMSDQHSRLAADLAARRWLSAARRILLRMSSFLPNSALRVMGPHERSGGNAEFFDQEGTRFLTDVLAFILMVTAPAAPPPDAWLDRFERCSTLLDDTIDPDLPEQSPDDIDPVRQWVRELHARARASGNHARGPNIIALCRWALEGPLVMVRERSGSNSHDRPPTTTWFFADVAERAEFVWCTLSEEGTEVLRRIRSSWRETALKYGSQGQHEGVVASARTICEEFASPGVAHSLYFGCEPGLRVAQEDTFDFRELVSRQGDGRLVLFQPARNGVDDLIALVLKALFFEAVLSDPDRVAGDPTMPLVGYVADEFHRFVTSDVVHGEQSFLDTCRSFGAFCVLATQSVASIDHALSVGGGSETTNHTARKILWNNTASKFFFRSTDYDTAAALSTLCPVQPGLPCLTEMRPITNLVPGECYAALADGRLERHQLERFLFEENADRMCSEAVADTANGCAQHRVRRRKRRGRGTGVAR